MIAASSPAMVTKVARACALPWLPVPQRRLSPPLQPGVKPGLGFVRRGANRFHVRFLLSQGDLQRLDFQDDQIQPSVAA